MLVENKAAGMVGTLARMFPDAVNLRCTVCFYGNALSRVPRPKKAVVDSEWGSRRNLDASLLYE